MASLMSQSLLTYVEEGNVPALKALLEKCRDVDERNEVRWLLWRSVSYFCFLVVEKIIRDCTNHLIYTFQFYFLLFAYLCADRARNIQCKHSHILHSNCFLSVLLSWKVGIHPFFENCFLVHRSSCVCFFSPCPSWIKPGIITILPLNPGFQARKPLLRNPIRSVFSNVV